jgi:hypothetical protein
MAQETRPIDANGMPDVSRLVHEVNRDGRPRLILADGESARLSPVRVPRRRADPSQADIQAALATAGAWKGLMDPEELKQRLREEQWDESPAPRL